MHTSILPVSLAALSSLAIPAIVIAVVIAIVVVGIVVASRYKRIPPNAIGVFYGRRYVSKGVDGQPVERGFSVVTGGGRILMPIVEQYQEMSTAAFQVEISETDVPTSKNVPVQIIAVATCRISPNPDEQSNAVQAFLGKEDREISSTINQILRGHVRSIIAGLSVEQILRDRAEFNKKVLEESADEFRKLGIQIITLVVQDVKDTLGYIQALGQQEVAEKKRDAAINVSNAARQTAEVNAQNDVKIADAQKTRDVQVAEFKVQTETKRAEADLANAIAKTTQESKLRVLEADRDTAAAKAGIAVQEQRAILKERELNATIITEAKAKRDASVIDADAQQSVAERTARRIEIEADGKRAAAIKEGEGIASKTRAVANADADATRARLTADADGAKANQLASAEGTRANLLATADGTRANQLALAEGSKANLLATAAGTEAELLAKATGTLKLAEALKELDESGRLLMILDRVPALLDKGGDAGAKMLAAVFTPLGASLGAIKQVSIVDMGSDGKGGIAKFAGSIPSLLAEMLVKAEAQGIDIKPLLKLARIDTTKLQSMIGLVDSALPE